MNRSMPMASFSTSPSIIKKRDSWLFFSVCALSWHRRYTTSFQSPRRHLATLTFQISDGKWRTKEEDNKKENVSSLFLFNFRWKFSLFANWFSGDGQEADGRCVRACNDSWRSFGAAWEKGVSLDQLVPVTSSLFFSNPLKKSKHNGNEKPSSSSPSQSSTVLSVCFGGLEKLFEEERTKSNRSRRWSRWWWIVVLWKTSDSSSSFSILMN